MGSDRRGHTPRSAVYAALDEARFGPLRTLNLRSTLPTPGQAVVRAEAWLREKQASGAGEVLVITGRGNQSPGGVSVVRESVARLLASLRRRGVVRAVHEHTAGSFVVELAALTSLRDAAPRRKERRRAIVATPAALTGLSAESMALLRRVATRALEDLGVRDPAPFLEREMLLQFAHLAKAIPPGPQREQRLRSALVTLLEEYDAR